LIGAFAGYKGNNYIELNGRLSEGLFLSHILDHSGTFKGETFISLYNKLIKNRKALHPHISKHLAHAFAIECTEAQMDGYVEYLIEGIKQKNFRRGKNRRGLQNVVLPAEQQRELISIYSSKFTELRSYLMGRGIEVITPYGNTEKGEAYIGRDNKVTVEINANGQREVNEIVMLKEAFNALIIDAGMRDRGLGEEVFLKLRDRVRKDQPENPKDILELIMRVTEGFTLGRAQELIREGLREYELAEILDRMRREAAVIVGRNRDVIIEVSGIKGESKVYHLRDNPLQPLADPEKYHAKDLESVISIRHMSESGMKSRLKGAGKWSVNKGFSLSHTIVFITVLEIAHKASLLAEQEGKSFSDLSISQQRQFVKEAVEQVIYSVDIYMGIAGSALTGKAAGKVIKPTKIRPDSKLFTRFKASMTAQTMSVLTFAGWVAASQLYMHIVEDIPDAHDVRNLIGNASLTAEVGKSLIEHIRTGDIRDDFEHAIFQGFLNGDTVFFLGFAGIGGKAGASLGTLWFPGVGTAIGAFLGGLAGAVASVLVPHEQKSFITDILTNLGKWWGSFKRFAGREELIALANVNNPTELQKELMKDILEKEIDGRNGMIDSLLGIYTRNLQIWISRQELAGEYSEELALFDMTGEFKAKRKYEKIDIKSSGITVDHYMKERTPSELRKAILYDIETNGEKIEYFRNKTVEASQAIMDIIEDEIDYYESLPQLKPISDELADLKGIKVVMSQVLDTDTIADEINMGLLELKPTIITVFNILPPLVTYGFTKDRLEKTLNRLFKYNKN
jgi:hypothetical protein